VAKIVQSTRNGDRIEYETDDPEVIRRAENEHADDSSNIAWTQVTGL
jgi:hypothetical protein